jgi:hypothetical protein
MLLNEYEIEFMFRKVRNIRNLGNVHIRGPHIVMNRTDAQNGLDFHFKHVLGLRNLFKAYNFDHADYESKEFPSSRPAVFSQTAILSSLISQQILSLFNDTDG